MKSYLFHEKNDISAGSKHIPTDVFLHIPCHSIENCSRENPAAYHISELMVH